MTTYRVYTDGIFGGIRASDEDPDGTEVFATFPKAKAALVKAMTKRATDYRQAAAFFRTLTPADVEEGEDIPFNKWEQDGAEG